MKLPDGLRRFREELNITQKQAATLAGVTTRGYQRYESGERVPTVQVLIALADKFNVSIDYLVGRTDNPKINK